MTSEHIWTAQVERFPKLVRRVIEDPDRGYAGVEWMDADDVAKVFTALQSLYESAMSSGLIFDQPLVEDALASIGGYVRNG